MADETFTDFMIRCMEGEDSVSQAVIIVRRTNQTIGYRTFNREIADTLGTLRVAALSVENDLVNDWKNE